MSDLTEIQSSQSVKVSGGAENYYAEVDAQNRVLCKDVISVQGRTASINLSANTPTLARATGSDLSGRVSLVIHNPNPGIIYWTYVNSISAGIPIRKDETVYFRIKEGIAVYIYCSTATSVVVSES